MLRKRNRRKQRKELGLPPGSLVYTGNLKSSETYFSLYVFNDKFYQTFGNEEVARVIEKIDPEKKCWLKVEGLSQSDPIQKIGKELNISSLILEDVLDVNQRPKCNVYEDYIFFTLKSLGKTDKDSEAINYRQISLILKDNLVISFHEKEEEWLKTVTARLEKNDTLLRTKPIDYLFYRLIDTVVDYYYVGIDELEYRIEDIEVNMNKKVENQDLQEIQQLKRDLIVLRKNVYPLREAISLVRKDDDFISKSVVHYLSDIYEHTIHIIEMIETYRDLTSGLMDLYMTGISNKMNEVMKVLTIIATIFIPLTFIAGVYGMNFRYMPELEIKWAYPATILVMLIIAGGMILYFKKKKWL